MNIKKNLLETIGNTPLVRFDKFSRHYGIKANILGKCEFFNPLASVKDRIALNMIEKGEREGKINEETLIIEPTSGNTGIGLAFVCAIKGYRLILTMPENMSTERQKMLKHLGAEIVLTSAESGMAGAIQEAKNIESSNDNALILQQFTNSANPEAHEKTAQEIWDDTDGKIEAVVSPVGTGGTLTGIGKILKQYNPKIRMIAVEPAASAILSGGTKGPHKIQGIGAGFVPEILDRTIIDDIITVTNNEAFAYARKIAKLEGVPCGISSGSALAGALKIGQRAEMEDKNIVVMIPSFAERYLSTELFDIDL